ncbi:MAG: phosphatase PAP2 family protein [Lachnospiraceae bacterium]|nr:phosphatase PAP2 family protein [Lachnospiraceae bacterium]
MSEEFYVHLNQYMKTHERFLGLVRLAERCISAVVFISYPLFLIWCFQYNPSDLPKTIGIPLAGFLGVSAARYFIGASRPYERYPIAALIPKNTVHKSFPSRHVFSVFMLAETYLYATTDAFALPFYAAGLVLAACRVLLGVHFISDVVVGMMVALFCGVLYYVL